MVIDTWTLCARLVLSANLSAAMIASTLAISLPEAMDRLTAVIAVREW